MGGIFAYGNGIGYFFIFLLCLLILSFLIVLPVTLIKLALHVTSPEEEVSPTVNENSTDEFW